MRARVLSALLLAVLPLSLACSSSDDVTPSDGGALEGGANDASLSDAHPDVGAPPDVNAAPPLPCNAYPDYCSLTYDAVTYPTTHGATAYVNPPFLCPTQALSPSAQLGDGIRALQIELHSSGAGASDGGDLADAGASVLTSCVNDCTLGEAPIASTLLDVKTFLATNPRDVVTLLLSGDGIDAGALASAIEAAGLSTFALSRATGDAWPTLASMITNGTRLVVFADVTGTPPPWMLSLSTYVASTGTTFTTTTAMTCDVTAGSTSAPFYALEETLVATGSDASPDGASCASTSLAAIANAEPFFQNRVNACAQQRGAKPRFLVVDFCDEGDVQTLAHTLSTTP